MTALVVGALVAVIVGLPLQVGLLFGSVVAATDPFAVVLFTLVVQGLTLPLLLRRLGLVRPLRRPAAAAV